MDTLTVLDTAIAETAGLLVGVVLLWSVIGGFAYEVVREMVLPPFWRAYCIFIGGPACWVLSVYRGLSILRARILAHYGMEDYSCCGEGRDHGRHNHSTHSTHSAHL